LPRDTELSELPIESLPGAFFTLDERGRLARWNRQLERASGYSNTDLGDLDDPLLLVPAEERAPLRAHLAAVLAGGDRTAEVTLVSKTGRHSRWYLSVCCLDRDGRRYLLGIATDITVRQQAELERQKLASLVGNSADFISIASLAGKIEFINPAGCQLVGIETASGSIANVLAPESRTSFQQEVLPLVRDRSHWQGETDLRASDGRTIPVLANLFLIRDRDTRAPIALATITRDISARKRAEAEMRASEERYRSAVESIEEAILQTDAAGRLTFLNPAWTELTRFDSDTSLDYPLSDFVLPEDTARYRRLFLPLLDGREFACRCELRLRTKPGLICWVALAAQVRYDDSGAIAGTSGTLNDITDRKLTEDQLRAVIDTVPGLVAWVDRDGHYLGVNHRLAETLNLTPRDFVGKELEFLETSPSFARHLRDFLASDRATDSQTIVARTGDSTRTYLIAAQKYRQGSAAVSVGIDITDRKDAELVLRQSEEKFRQLAENIEQVFWMTDLARQETIYVSPAYEWTWGRPLARAYAPPDTWLDAVHPEDRDRVRGRPCPSKSTASTTSSTGSSDPTARCAGFAIAPFPCATNASASTA